MSDPKVSVVMSVKNGEKYLRESIDSILGQDFAEFEFIIVDDGSTDSTSAILADYARKDLRVKVHTRSHLGLVDALNYGCAQAKGKYIARMDADDIAVPNRLALQHHFMQSHAHTGVCGGHIEVIGPNGAPANIDSRVPMKDASIRQAMRENNALWHPTVMMRRDSFESVGGYRHITAAEDYDLWLRIAETSEIRNLPNVLLRYRIHPGQVSASKCYQQVLGAAAARVSSDSRKRGGGDVFNTMKGITEEEVLKAGVSRPKLQNTLARAYLTWIRNMYLSGQHKEAIEIFEQSEGALHPEDIEPWIKAESCYYAAMAYWKEKRAWSSITHLAFAFASRPLTLARMLARMLKN